MYCRRVSKEGVGLCPFYYQLRTVLLCNLTLVPFSFSSLPYLTQSPSISSKHHLFQTDHHVQQNPCPPTTLHLPPTALLTHPCCVDPNPQHRLRCRNQWLRSTQLRDLHAPRNLRHYHLLVLRLLQATRPVQPLGDPDPRLLRRGVVVIAVECIGVVGGDVGVFGCD